jgi:hypothetical protein
MSNVAIKFSYRAIGFQKTVKGYWFFDNLPFCGNAWERYATDEEIKSITNPTINNKEKASIIHKMIDRMLENRIIYRGDLRYRF